MKISNFNPIGPETKRFANVDVTTGLWLWKKTETRTVYKDVIFWRFADNGEFTPNRTVETLEQAYDVQAELAGLLK